MSFSQSYYKFENNYSCEFFKKKSCYHLISYNLILFHIERYKINHVDLRDDKPEMRLIEFNLE